MILLILATSIGISWFYGLGVERTIIAIALAAGEALYLTVGCHGFEGHGVRTKYNSSQNWLRMPTKLVIIFTFFLLLAGGLITTTYISTAYDDTMLAFGLIMIVTDMLMVLRWYFVDYRATYNENEQE